MFGAKDAELMKEKGAKITVVSQVIKPMRFSMGIRLLPIIFGIIWLNLTIFLFEFGPFSYPDIDHLTLNAYLFIANYSICLGYVIGVSGVGKGYSGSVKPRQLLRICGYMTLAWMLISMTTWPSPKEVILAYLSGSSDIIRSQALNALGGRWQDYISIFLSPFIFIVVTAGVYYWGSSGTYMRALVFATIVFKILGSIMTGGRIGMVEIFILVGLSYIANCFKTRDRFPIIRFLVIVGLIFFVIFAYSTFITVSRSGLDAESYIERYVTPGYGVLDKNSAVVLLAPTVLAPLLIQSIAYVSHGYYALALCLEKSFHGITFGFGHSPSLIRLADRFTASDYFDSSSYYTRLLLEDAYSSQLFMTGYIWIANDVTFIGSLLVLFIFGYLLGKSWLDTLAGNNPFAVTIFSLFVLMLISLSMYSTILDPAPFISFYSILILWWLTRSKISS